MIFTTNGNSKMKIIYHRSLGGQIVDGGQSVTAWGINVGNKLAQGVSKLYSNIFSTTSSSMSSCHPSLPLSSMSSTGSNNQQEMQKGIVTILDVLQICNSTDQDEVNLNDKMAGVIAHFVAHNKAVVAMEFDSNGTLLLTADSVGNYFNLFKVSDKFDVCLFLCGFFAVNGFCWPFGMKKDSHVEFDKCSNFP